MENGSCFDVSNYIAHPLHHLPSSSVLVQVPYQSLAHHWSTNSYPTPLGPINVLWTMVP